MTQDQRRAARTIVHSLGALAMLGFLGWVIHKLDGGPLERIGLALVAILFVRELLHGAENVTARIKFHAGMDGIDGEIGE